MKEKEYPPKRAKDDPIVPGSGDVFTGPRVI